MSSPLCLSVALAVALLVAVVVAEMTVPPGAVDGVAAEARCALSFLPAVLLPSGPYAAKLFLVGQPPWLETLLFGLPPVATVTVLSGVDEHLWPEGPVVLGMSEPTSLVLVVGASPAELTALARAFYVPSSVRVVYWTTVAGGWTPADTQRMVAMIPPGCVGELRVAVTAADEAGDTALYDVHGSECGSQRPTVVELDRWSGTSGEWRRGVPLFSPPCSAWAAPPPDEPPAFLVLHYPGLMFAKAWWPRAVREMLRGVAMTGVRFEERLWSDQPVGTVGRALMHCQLDAVAYPRPISLFLRLGITWFPHRLYGLVLVVPKVQSNKADDTGMGARGNKFDALTGNDSRTLWLVTGLSGLVVGVGIFYARPAMDRGKVALQVLAPMLGQSYVHMAVGAQRPLLGAWLLVSLVAMAGYQEQWLRLLTTATRDGEVTTVEAVEALNLTVTTFLDFADSARGLFSDDNRIHVVSSEAMGALLHNLTLRRDTAILLGEDMLPAIAPLLQEPPEVHVFRVPSAKLHKTLYATTEGSPLEPAIRKVAARLAASGVDEYWQRAASATLDRLLRQDCAVCSAGSAASEGQSLLFAPLPLHMVAPMFFLLGGGLGLAAAFFLAELYNPPRRKRTDDVFDVPLFEWTP